MCSQAKVPKLAMVSVAMVEDVMELLDQRVVVSHVQVLKCIPEVSVLGVLGKVEGSAL